MFMFTSLFSWKISLSMVLLIDIVSILGCDGVSCLHHLPYDLILITWAGKISELVYRSAISPPIDYEDRTMGFLRIFSSTMNQQDSSTRGQNYLVEYMLKSMLSSEDILTWFLIFWWMCYEPIRCHAYDSCTTRCYMWPYLQQRLLVAPIISYVIHYNHPLRFKMPRFVVQYHSQTSYRLWRLYMNWTYHL